MRLSNFQYTGIQIENFDERCTYALDTKLTDLTLKLMLKKPNWTFLVSPSARTSLTAFVCKSVKVLQRDEPLGVYSLDIRRSKTSGVCEDVFNITSPRINKRRYSTKNTMKTAEQSSALKIILEYFTPKNTNERFESLTEGMTSIIQRVQRAKQETVTKRCPLGVNGRWVYAYMENTNQLGNYLDFVLARNNKPQTGEAMLRAKEAVDDFVLTDDVLGQGLEWKEQAKGIAVLDNDLVMFKPHNAEVQAWDQYDEAIPVDLRAKIGMLKLVEPTQIVRDVGMRVTDNVFLIAQTENNNA